MDVHVPLPITRGLRRRGVDVLTAQDDNTQRYFREGSFYHGFDSASRPHPPGSYGVVSLARLTDGTTG
jgi:hypothetical protein